MILKMLLFPFLLIKSCIGLIVSIIRFIFFLISRVFRFGFGRVSGAIFGALIGAAGGREHLRVRWFRRKK